MSRILSWIRNHILLTIGIVIVIGIVIFLAIYIHRSTHGGIYGDRCSDNKKYKVNNNVLKKIKDQYKTIDQVKNIEIYTKLCTIKIIIHTKEDADLESVKNVSNDILSLFSKKQLKYYDFALYVYSDNKKSGIYPINVSKHKSEQGFAW